MFNGGSRHKFLCVVFMLVGGKSLNDSVWKRAAFAAWTPGPLKGPGKLCVIDAQCCNLMPIRGILTNEIQL